MDENSTIYDHNRTVRSAEEDIPSLYKISPEDANWIITAAFIIFTMQTGFGMLESGCVSQKNEVNIMMKNVADIFLGGVTYWAVGFGFSFGHYWSCPVLAVGEFFLDSDPEDKMGHKFTAFLFQLSFATTATTIVSGAMAERCNFQAYCIFSFLNTVVYCIPAGWVWGDHGFLNHLGAVDIAGSGPVHLIGGVSAFASALMLGPRLGRYTHGTETLGTPVNCAMGLFVLWWGWLAFNSGSTYGVAGAKWEYAAKAAVMTMLSSFGGGFVGLCYTLYVNKGQTNIMDMINSVLGSLVSVTAGCFLYSSWDAIVIGCVGAFLTCFTAPLFDKLEIDDPVGAAAVHGVSGVWGVLAVGLFASEPIPLETTRGRKGLFKGGGVYLLGVQALTCVCLGLYSFTVTVIILWSINKFSPLRMSAHEELLGADFSEHGIRHRGVGVTRAASALNGIQNEHVYNVSAVKVVGTNIGHEKYLEQYVKEKIEQNGKLKPSNERILNMMNMKFSDPQPNIAWMD